MMQRTGEPTTQSIATLEALTSIPLGTVYVVEDVNKTFIKTTFGWKETGGSVNFF